MLCHQGTKFITILLSLYLSISSTHAFGGRRKNIAHIFGKRADTIADTNPWSRQRYSPLTEVLFDRPRSQDVDLDYLIDPDQDDLEVVLPIQTNSLDWSDVIGDASQTSGSNRFADLIRDNETNNRKESNLRKHLNDYLFNRLSRYNK